MSRRLNRDYRTKIRNIPRRMKALNCWAESFQNPERAVFAEDQRYWNFKIPVDINLVEGKHRTQKTQAECAQALINACSHLMQATADLAGTPRITAVICLPDMFTIFQTGYRRSALRLNTMVAMTRMNGLRANAGIMGNLVKDSRF